MAENKTVALVVTDQVGDYEVRQAQGRNGDPAVAALGEAVQASRADGSPRAFEVPSPDDVAAAEGRLHYAAKKVGLSVKVLGYGKGSKRGSVKVVWQGIERRPYTKGVKTVEADVA